MAVNTMTAIQSGVRPTSRSQQVEMSWKDLFELGVIFRLGDILLKTCVAKNIEGKLGIKLICSICCTGKKIKEVILSSWESV